MKVVEPESNRPTMRILCLGIKYEQTGCGKTLEINPEDVENIRSSVFITCPECGAKTFINPCDMSTNFYNEWIKLKH